MLGSALGPIDVAPSQPLDQTRMILRTGDFIDVNLGARPHILSIVNRYSTFSSNGESIAVVARQAGEREARAEEREWQTAGMIARQSAIPVETSALAYRA